MFCYLQCCRMKQRNVLNLACEPIPVLRIGFVGLGNRGLLALERYMHLDGVEVKAICDLREENLKLAQDVLKKFGKPLADCYSSGDAWQELCQRQDIDLVYICTDWLTHTDIAVYAMQQDKHAALEVPAAMTVKDCWRLVDTAEQTQRHCMMLENCCYDSYALTTLNMVKKGVFGEITHAEGAYIHDIRRHYFAEANQGGFHNHWIKLYSQTHTGNPYPTHGLGPICQWLGIHRGDRMEYLVSMSSRQAGLSAYAEKKFGSGSAEAEQDYLMGDVNTTLIHTVKGRTIVLQYDVVTPRPYSRHQTLCGTRGFMQKYPVPCVLLDMYGQEPLHGEMLEAVMNQYKHPFTAVIGEEARQKNMPNEMNYIMDYRLVHCLRNGLPLDQDVYDAAEWSCITELSELSVRQGSIPVEIPDFTRGNWR